MEKVSVGSEVLIPIRTACVTRQQGAELLAALKGRIASGQRAKLDMQGVSLFSPSFFIGLFDGATDDDLKRINVKGMNTHDLGWKILMAVLEERIDGQRNYARFFKLAEANGYQHPVLFRASGLINVLGERTVMEWYDRNTVEVDPDEYDQTVTRLADLHEAAKKEYRMTDHIGLRCQKCGKGFVTMKGLRQHVCKEK